MLTISLRSLRTYEAMPWSVGAVNPFSPPMLLLCMISSRSLSSTPHLLIRMSIESRNAAERFVRASTSRPICLRFGTSTPYLMPASDTLPPFTPTCREFWSNNEVNKGTFTSVMPPLTFTLAVRFTIAPVAYTITSLIFESASVGAATPVKAWRERAPTNRKA